MFNCFKPTVNYHIFADFHHVTSPKYLQKYDNINLYYTIFKFFQGQNVKKNMFRVFIIRQKNYQDNHIYHGNRTAVRFCIKPKSLK